MAQLLQATQASLGSWVGSSVVHLGDHNVPNALTFIDKYCQVPLILNPVISVCLDLPLVAAKDAGMRKYMESAFGSVGAAIDAVLVDFFRQVALLSFSFSFFILPQPLARSLSLIFSTRSKTKKLDKNSHAFDGSGADNFFDAGSCVDGRLTSAWNWGSKIEKKKYYNLFKVAGFSGFDGKDWSE